VLHGRIETTEAKAKSIKPLADKMVTLGKRGDLAARRQAAAFLLDPAAVRKLFDDLAPRYADRNGGYTRIIKTGVRRGDAAPMAIIEWV
jgi:large subunit ribosomal protein L17